MFGSPRASTTSLTVVLPLWNWESWLSFTCVPPAAQAVRAGVLAMVGGDNHVAVIEDPPGLREGGMGPLHLAYVRDPDGNKLCALYRGT